MKIATPQSLPDGDSSSAGIVVHVRDDERRFGGGQRNKRLAVSCGQSRRGRYVRRRLWLRLPRDPRRNRGAGEACAKQEFSARQRIVCHVNLPRCPDRMRAACVGFGKSPMQLSRPGYLSRAGGEEDRSEHRRRPGLRCRRSWVSACRKKMQRSPMSFRWPGWDHSLRRLRNVRGPIPGRFVVAHAALRVSASRLPRSRSWARLSSLRSSLFLTPSRSGAAGVSVDLSPRLERVQTRSLGPSSIPSLGDGVMLGTAWIDRPVDTQGCAPCFHVLLSAAWKRGHAQANDRLPLASLRCPPEALPGRPETADTVAAA